MPNIVNQLVLAEYQADFSRAEALLLVSMGGLTVAEVEALRGKLAEAGVGLRMVRNSIARRVLAERGHEFGDALAGNVGVAYGSAEGVVQAAKAMTAPEVRKLGKLALRGGVVEGAQLGAADALALAEVPDKDTLRAQLVGVIQAPLRGLASVLEALPGGVARLLRARVDQQGGSGPAEAPAPEAAG